jgi:hypothetical protein
MSQQKQFKPVELEQSIQGSALAETATISWRSLIFAFVSFVLFQSVSCVAAVKTPSLRNTTLMNYPFVKTHKGFSEVRFSINSLTPAHGVLEMDVSLVRLSALDSTTKVITVNQTLDLCQGLAVIARRVESQRGQVLTFSDGETVSSELTIFRLAVGNYDTINVSLAIDTHTDDCKAFRLKYAFNDPKAETFVRSVRLILAASGLYAFIAFLICPGRSALSSDSIPSIVLGVFTIFASNPIGALLSLLEWATPITMVVFLSMYRFFSLVALRKRGGGLKEPWVIGALLLSLIYGFVECLATYPSSLAPTLRFELIAMHLSYMILVIVLLCVALCTYPQVQRFRAIAFGVFIFVSSGMTIVSEVCFKRRDSEFSTLSVLLYQSSHILSAIVFLYFENASTAGYEKLTSLTRVANTGDLDVELEHDELTDGEAVYD